MFTSSFRRKVSGKTIEFQYKSGKVIFSVLINGERRLYKINGQSSKMTQPHAAILSHFKLRPKLPDFLEQKKEGRDLHSTYKDFQEFKDYCQTYGIHKRLGFRSMKAAWKANPRYYVSISSGNSLHVIP